MAHKESRTQQAEAGKETTAEVMVGAKMRFEELASAQNDFFGKWQEANRHWLERMQTEANLASELTAKLSAARRYPASLG